MSNYSQIYKNVYLDSNNPQWGNANIDIVKQILICIIKEFEFLGFNQDTMPQVLITHSLLGKDYPMCCRVGESHMIFLHTKDNYWCQYIYQFAHEFCHHVIAGPLDGELKSSFWFEESICELASCYILVMLALHFHNLESSDNLLHAYTPNVQTYLSDHMSRIPVIDIKLNQWIKNNLSRLQEPEHHRDLYAILAKQLLPAFIKNPTLWKLLPYIKRVDEDNYLYFEHWIKCVIKPQIPDNLTNEYQLLENLLIG